MNRPTLACDLSTGRCGPDEPATAPVHVTYVTDPICSACWAMEPAWRALEVRYGDQLRVRHVYGGLLPSWDGFADAAHGIRGPGDVAEHWRQIAAGTGQAMTAAVWDDDPIDSSSPPSLVLAAVRDIDPDREPRALRLVREQLFLHGRNIARPEVWSPAVRAAGIDPHDVTQRLADGRARAVFAADLAFARSSGIAAFPTLVVETAGGRVRLQGVQSPERLESVVTALGAAPPADRPATVDDAVAVLGVGTGAEYAAVLGRPVPATEALLRAAGLTATPLPGGSAWTP